MISINQTGKIFVIMVLAGFLGLMLFSGCTDEKKVVETVVEVQHDTIFVSIIAVDAINASMDSVSQGLPITLTVQITKGSQAGDVTINWFATGGHFDSEAGDTVTWTSPDDPGVYTISAHATDGEFIGIGSRMVGVGMYVPTTTPYYLGADACGGCHEARDPEIWNGWLGTAHAHAWETLQNSGHPAAHCNPCHATGWPFNFADSSFIANAGDGGFDEAPIEKFVNVQCENCHNAGSDHISGGSPDPTKIDISYDVMICGQCHEGTHHPYLTEWKQSPHNFPGDSHASASCTGCHEGVAAAQRLSDESNIPLNIFYGGGGGQAITTRPDTSVFPYEGVVCQTCHDPHDATNFGQLRTVDDIVLIEEGGVNPVITEGGTGKLCMQCHHARHGPEEHIPEGDSRFGPHHSPQADVLAAKTGFTGVAPAGFNWAGPSHLLVQNSCKTCHLNMIEFPGPSGSAVTGHTFLPTPEACVNCHGAINDFNEIPAAADFDGDGDPNEGLQGEVKGLMDLLRDAIVASGLDTTVEGFVGAIGDTAYSTLQQREAGWNWVFVEDDQSHGIHNPDYIVQLLQQSILHVGGTLPQPAMIVRNDNEVVGSW